MRFSLPALARAIASLVAVSNSPAAELIPLDQPDPARDARVAWHREARFGCFVHWGVYSGPAGVWKGRAGGTYSEHLMRSLEIPRQEYLDEIARPFNPQKFDADAWVKLMSEAGMRYLVITSKHHDGFAMYPSKVSDYNLKNVTAFKRDPMAELKAACAKYGLKFGFYYSHAWDWEHPDAIGNYWDYGKPGGQSGWWNERPDLIPKARRYIESKAIPQIRELAQMYHPDIFWFDTSSKTPPELNQLVLEAVRSAAPDTVINSRLVGAYGDYRSTSDRPAYFPEVNTHWEAIPTTNESYGYKPSDTSHKPPSHFIRLLAMAVSKGGNILLNIGPRGDGTIDPVDADILRGIGAWMKKNGESIYGCDRTPLSIQPWGASTRKGNRLYLHVFDWPENRKLVVGGLRSVASSVRLLNSDTPVGWKRLNSYDVELELPDVQPDSADTVIVMDFPGQIAADKTRLAPASGPATVLHVFDGNLSGNDIRYGDGKRGRDVVEKWPTNDGHVSWEIRVPVAGTFSLSAQYNSPEEAVGSEYAIDIDGQALRGEVLDTENLETFRTDTLGDVRLDEGIHTVTVRPIRIKSDSLMRLRSVILDPAETQ